MQPRSPACTSVLSSTCCLNASDSARPVSATASRFHTASSPESIGCTACSHLETGIDFEAIDERPVDLIFMLLAPENAGADHLKALARVSRLLRDTVICEKLRGSDKAEALYALLTETATSHAA